MAKGLRRLKARSSCLFSGPRFSHITLSMSSRHRLKQTLMPHSIIHGDALFANFNKI
jgi:hypothetical protein